MLMKKLLTFIITLIFLQNCKKDEVPNYIADSINIIDNDTINRIVNFHYSNQKINTTVFYSANNEQLNKAQFTYSNAGKLIKMEQISNFALNDNKNSYVHETGKITKFVNVHLQPLKADQKIVFDFIGSNKVVQKDYDNSDQGYYLQSTTTYNFENQNCKTIRTDFEYLGNYTIEEMTYDNKTNPFLKSKFSLSKEIEEVIPLSKNNVISSFKKHYDKNGTLIEEEELSYSYTYDDFDRVTVIFSNNQKLLEVVYE